MLYKWCHISYSTSTSSCTILNYFLFSRFSRYFLLSPDFPLYNLKNGLTGYTLEEWPSKKRLLQKKKKKKLLWSKHKERFLRLPLALNMVLKAIQASRTTENSKNLLPPRASKNFKILAHLSWQNAVIHSVWFLTSTQWSDPSMRITVWGRHPYKS